MAAALTGTPVAWTTGNVTVPSDCNAIYGFWSYLNDSAIGGVSAATIGGTAFTKASTKSGQGFYLSGGLIIWYGVPTGSQAVSVTWSPAVSYGIGPALILCFVTGADTSGERDADAVSNTGSDESSFSLTTNSTDLVIKGAAAYSASMPAAGTGWTSRQTQSASGPVDMRVCTCDSPGASTTTVNDEITATYSCVVAVSIKAGAAGSGSLVIPSRAAIQSILSR